MEVWKICFGSALPGPLWREGGDLHADEARQHGEDAAGDEGEGGELGEHLASGGEGDDQKNDEDHDEDLNICINVRNTTFA